jgi:hypothetical protein
LPDTSSRRLRPLIGAVVVFLLLLSVSTALACAASRASLVQGPATTPLVTGISVLADVIKIAEVLVVLWGARQLWIGRGERKAAEEAAAALARKAANYQAWQVVNTAQGKGGSGGRIDALQDLVTNGVSLAGVRLDEAWLDGIQLAGARLERASLRKAILRGANLQRANLQGADLTGADLTGADLRDAILKDATVARAVLSAADLEGADLAQLQDWEALASVSYTQIAGVRHAPPGWRDWILERGAIDGEPAEELPTSGQTFSQEWRTV